MKKTMMFLAAGLIIALPSVYGSPVAPGNTVTPDIFSTASGYTILNSISGNGSASNAGGAISFSYTEYVASDPNNVLCVGCLDFAFQVTNTGGDHLESLSTASFAGFLTDVGYYDGQPGINPDTVARDSDPGSVIHFNFTGSDDITTGESSRYLVVETNAMGYQAGSITAQDGATADVAGFAPAVPEPMSMGLLGGGLMLLGLVGYRRRKAVKQ